MVSFPLAVLRVRAVFYHDVCLPARSETVKPGNLFHGKAFQWSGRGLDSIREALEVLQSEDRRRLTTGFGSIGFV